MVAAGSGRTDRGRIGFGDVRPGSLLVVGALPEARAISGRATRDEPSTGRAAASLRPAGAMERRGWSEERIRFFLGENWLAFLEEVWGA